MCKLLYGRKLRTTCMIKIAFIISYLLSHSNMYKCGYVYACTETLREKETEYPLSIPITLGRLQGNVYKSKILKQWFPIFPAWQGVLCEWQAHTLMRAAPFLQTVGTHVRTSHKWSFVRDCKHSPLIQVELCVCTRLPLVQPGSEWSVAR